MTSCSCLMASGQGAEGGRHRLLTSRASLTSVQPDKLRCVRCDRRDRKARPAPTNDSQPSALPLSWTARDLSPVRMSKLGCHHSYQLATHPCECGTPGAGPLATHQ